ncbi:MAG: 2-amino-4-hydroxy-6-hydroxymethyldihydropteridine diphosphokinase [Gammaproteobacteria bacterium]|nr:2-amino-4-hydroxy-6-hydroxymethyldihydropteridine diphosphokinase [Gammaproteobacteria bacterium]
MTTRAYIALGSNLNDPLHHIKTALDELQSLDPHPLQHSALYRSAPHGPVAQPGYINAVAALDTALDAKQLLTRLLAIETRHGRIRTGERWGPRTLDLDLLLYGDMQCTDDTLSLPHPRLHERNFVLYPLYEIAPQLHIPGRGMLRELIRRCPAHGLTRLTGL